MSRTGRPPNTVPTIRWDTYIPVDTAAQVELLLLDPVRQKVEHGARSRLIAQLLRGWVEEQKRKMHGAQLTQEERDAQG